MATQKGRNWSSGDIVTAANLSSIERGVSAVAEEYTPTTWANGNTVTAASLNNIEQGIADAGGGGSSDFSTATLTLIRGVGARGTLYVSNLMASPIGTSLFSMLNYIEGTNTYEVVIYSGGTVLNYEGSDTVTVDGNIQDVGNGSYLITGDCTITIS